MSAAPAAGDGSARQWWLAARDAAVTSLAFLIVYNLTNRITHLRGNAGVWVFEWERQIPLLPWMILPYWSEDVFFVAAPFVSASVADRVMLRKRLVGAILVAGACFLLVPLRFAWPRPEVEGVWGLWFRALHGVDLPHNLFPSLHIAFRALLVGHYVRAVMANFPSGPLRGSLLGLVHGWFCLIGFSTLFTHQHHFVDVLGGFLLAGVCLAIWPQAALSKSAPTNFRVGTLYFAGCVALALAARSAFPWTLLFWWPAAALGVAAAGYFGAGPQIYGKQNGRIPWWQRVLMAPQLAGHWISLWHYRRAAALMDHIEGGVWIGSYPKSAAGDSLRAAGIKTVIDLTAEFSRPQLPEGIACLSFPVLDLTAPGNDQLHQISSAISAAAAVGPVLVHCKAGFSRSAAAVARWLLDTGQVTSGAAALRLLRERRPGMIIRPEVIRLFGNPEF